MSQEKQYLPPKRREPEPDPPVMAPKAAAPKHALSELNVDDLLSKDAEEFLRQNQQKGGE